MTIATNQSVRLRRLAAVLALRGCTITQFAEQLDVSATHLRAVIVGDRQSSKHLGDAIRNVLGEHWRFVIGVIDTLVVGAK